MQLYVEVQGVQSTLSAVMSLHASTVGSNDGADFVGYDVPLLTAIAQLLKKLPSGQEAVLPSCLQVSLAAAALRPSFLLASMHWPTCCDLQGMLSGFLRIFLAF